MMKAFRVLVIIFMVLGFQSALAKSNRSQVGKKITRHSRGLAATPVKEKMKIRGQSRSLNMMLVVKNKKDRINFVKLRTDYVDEILTGTEF